MYLSDLKYKKTSLKLLLNCNYLSNVFQSAYKQFHFTKPTLLNVDNDIALNIDRRKVRALILLDVSAAFMTIDYSILLGRLGMVYLAKYSLGSAHS